MAKIPDDREPMNSRPSQDEREPERDRYSSRRREEEKPRNSYGDHDLVPDATAEIKAMAKEGLDHPSTKPVLTGAAVGAIAAGVLPVVTWPMGLVAGAGFMLYKRLRH
ncbi:hypothetical protein [Erythrobacter sp. SD-21]|uniref:hypothetical protein n=1 Tax=Erythrobacter sp. SD-21 TaxID=161528 RepID=UPI000153F558|nr:hypothetical protein [Erythrobacter sp. SD-21]EDL50192.1 hypothetical protein ED21_27013 [Erythrobacter sp. SD-21]